MKGICEIYNSCKYGDFCPHYTKHDLYKDCALLKCGSNNLIECKCIPLKEFRKLKLLKINELNQT